MISCTCTRTYPTHHSIIPSGGQQGCRPDEGRGRGMALPGHPPRRGGTYIYCTVSKQVFCRPTALRKTDQTGACFALYKYECLDGITCVLLIIGIEQSTSTSKSYPVQVLIKLCEKHLCSPHLPMIFRRSPALRCTKYDTLYWYSVILC